jgi:hypothetical protein
MVAKALSPIRVALSPTALIAVDARLRRAGGRADPADDAVWHHAVTPPPADGITWPALGAALRDLAAATGAEPGVLHIALLSPLTEVRRVDLPPLRADEQVRLLSRNAGRYFLHVREQQIVGVAPSPKGQSGGVVCAAVSARLVQILHAEATAAGWTVEQIVPAEAAWIAACHTVWPAHSRGEAITLVAHDDRTDLLHTKVGKLHTVRRFRAGAVDGDAIVQTISALPTGDAQNVAVFGVEENRKNIAAALSERGVSPRVPTKEHAAHMVTPPHAAAHFIAPNEPFRLRTDDAVARRQARERRATWQLALVASVLLLLAAAVEWIGVRRELTAVRAHRAAIAPQVRELLNGQQAQAATTRRIANIAESYVAAPQWSAAIATLSEALDNGAYLLMLRARGDTLTIDGLATQASKAFASVEKIPSFSSVRAAGEMRVERQDDGTLLERFTIQARVAHDSTGKQP